MWGFVKGELRTFLALILLLAIFIGFGFAAGDQSIIFDFGTGNSQELYPGALPVNGGSSVYPKTLNNITYGWQTPYVAEHSSGSQVMDLLKTDSNQGVNDNTFKISGLTSPYYVATIISGALNSDLTTKIVVNGTNYLINSSAGEWRTATFTVVINGGAINFLFKRQGKNLWGVNALTLTPSSTTPPIPTFGLMIEPLEHIVAVGGTALYRVSVAPENYYGSEVTLSMSGLPEGMSAQFTPVSGTPPFTASLEISTSPQSPTTRYSFMVTGRGSDPGSYTVNRDLGLLVTQLGEGIETQPTAPPISNQEAQARVERYLKLETKKLPDGQEISSLEDIAQVTSGIPVMPELPQPTSFMDASLLQLTKAGIISTVVDSAPPVRMPEIEPPQKPGFWAQFFGAMFSPVR